MVAASAIEVHDRCDDLECAWREAFPKHDFWSARLKRADSLATEPWRRAAAEYHRERGNRVLILDKPPKYAEWLRRMIADPSVSFDRLYGELNGGCSRPTPQVTIEAVIWSVRENGIGALESEANKARLESCDERARAEIKRRIATLRERGSVR